MNHGRRKVQTLKIGTLKFRWQRTNEGHGRGGGRAIAFDASGRFRSFQILTKEFGSGKPRREGLDSPWLVVAAEKIAEVEFQILS
jgi:hypothetical protein